MGPRAKAAVPALIALLKDRTSVECYEAAGALGRIGSAAATAVPALVEMLQERQEIGLPTLMLEPGFYCQLGSPVKVVPAFVAVTVLGAIGPAAKPAIPALKEAVKDPKLRRFAEDAIRQIESEGPAK